MITINEIEKIEDESLPFYRDLEVLMESIIEWGGDISTVDEYIVSIKEYLGGSIYLNKIDIKDILSGKNIFDDAWKLESISTLITILKDNDEILDTILSRLIKEVKDYLEK